MIHYFQEDTTVDRFNQHTTIQVQGECFSYPAKFTYPFHYTPHPLVVRAANEVNAYLASRDEWQMELSHGKMFGVLLVESCNNGQPNIGYLAAFSGNLAGSNHHEFFVPPVFDLLRPGDFFKVEEANISAINQRIKEIIASDEYAALKLEVASVRETTKTELAEAKRLLKEQKRLREEERAAIQLRVKALDHSQILNDSQAVDSIKAQSNSNAENSFKADQTRLEELIKESQFQKAEFKRLERRLKDELAEKEKALKAIDDKILQLKQERKSRSAALQLKLFEHFQLLNANGEVKDLCQIFEETRQSVPPAGAGECALPKLLQYAYLHHLKPLVFGEFWWGESPKDEIRRHGQFYPSCKGKCEPILKHMLVGLDVESNPLTAVCEGVKSLTILYEDEWLVAVEKPEGLLSTPGKEVTDSVSERLAKMYPQASGPLLVHRLDMATSGILLAAKDKEVHAQLQGLFEARAVKKIYTAILDGIPKTDDSRRGCINLPICLNPMDRPRQMVNYEFGKEAITYYKVIATKGNQALVEFDLLTGRTHQIRMHAAHPLGLNCPIKGDDLYGTHSDRLYLHATRVEFTHPVTGKFVSLTSEVPFIL